MTKVKSKYKQSIFDLVCQNFGQLDQLVLFARGNDVNINDNIAADTELTFANQFGIGNDKNKEAIKLKNVTLNNYSEPVLDVWILSTNFWVDSGTEWIDSETWND